MKSASAWPAAFVCRLLFYVEYNKEPALSANNSSETSSSDTCSFSIISFIKNRKKSLPGECPKVLILYKLQACSPTVLAATARKICAQNRANSHVFIYCEQTKRYIQKSKKSLPAAFGHMYAAYLFFSLWLPNCSVPAFKNFSQYPIKHELSYQSFLHYIFISILIILHHYYCVGVVEHSRCIHTNISIGFHIPELQQSRPQYGEITVFWMNLWGNCVDGI